MRPMSRTTRPFVASLVAALAPWALVAVLVGCRHDRVAEPMREPRPIVADGATLVEVACGFRFTEGPAVDADGNVYFSDQPNDRIVRWDAATGAVSDWLRPSGRANGMEFDREGRLVVCADGANELRRIDADGQVDVLAAEFDGRLLNGPNDVWCAPNGDLYLTDPWYPRRHWSEHRIERRRTAPTQEQPVQGVYRLPASGGKLELVAGDLVKPNGIAGSPDGRTLYVADIDDAKTWAYPIREDGSLGERRLVVARGSDGIAVDELGRLYLTGDGVSVFAPDGTQLATIPVPQGWTANVAFAGHDRRTLFITAGPCVYTLAMDVAGATIHPRPAIEELSFLAGAWRGTSDGAFVEELWSRPEGEAILGAFRWHGPKGGGLRMSELLAITREADAVRLRLRHFDPRMRGREPIDRPMVLVLRSFERTRDGGRLRFAAERDAGDLVSIDYVVTGERLAIDIRFAPNDEDPSPRLTFDLRRSSW
jgi:gluconolactonase